MLGMVVNPVNSIVHGAQIAEGCLWCIYIYKGDMSYSLNSLKGVIKGLYRDFRVSRKCPRFPSLDGYQNVLIVALKPASCHVKFVRTASLLGE